MWADIARPTLYRQIWLWVDFNMGWNWVRKLNELGPAQLPNRAWKWHILIYEKCRITWICNIQFIRSAKNSSDKRNHKQLSNAPLARLKYCRINKKREKATLGASNHVIFSWTFQYADRKSCSIFWQNFQLDVFAVFFCN